MHESPNLTPLRETSVARRMAKGPGGAGTEEELAHQPIRVLVTFHAGDRAMAVVISQ